MRFRPDWLVRVRWEKVIVPGWEPGTVTSDGVILRLADRPGFYVVRVFDRDLEAAEEDIALHPMNRGDAPGPLSFRLRFDDRASRICVLADDVPTTDFVRAHDEWLQAVSDLIWSRNAHSLLRRRTLEAVCAQVADLIRGRWADVWEDGVPRPRVVLDEETKLRFPR